MLIGIIGINHKSADVGFREQFAKACHRRFAPGYSAHAGVAYVLLSTCNRTEVYFCSEDLAATHTYILNVLRSDIEEEFEHRLYSYFGADCFSHLARVTAGIDSAIIGETEIQGQVKKAYEVASSYQILAKELHYLFQKCLKIGKEIRSSIVCAHQVPSLEEAIVTTSSYLLGDLRAKKVLFVGVSEINYKIFLSLRACQFKEITFCNRSSERAKILAEKEGVSWLPWETLNTWPTFDMILFGTKSPDYLVTKETVKESFSTFFPESQRLLIDLCVPRNVDPQLGKHPLLTLFNIDQLHKMINRKQRLKAGELVRLETQEIVRAVSKYMAIFKAKESYRLETAVFQAS